MSRNAHSMTYRATWDPVQKALYKYRDEITGEDVFGTIPARNTPHYYILTAIAYTVDRVPGCTFWHRLFSDCKNSYHATLRVEYSKGAFYFVAIQYVPEHDYFYINIRKDDRQLWDQAFLGRTIISNGIHLEGWCLHIATMITESHGVDALADYCVDMSLEEGEIRQDGEEDADVTGSFSPEPSPWD